MPKKNAPSNQLPNSSKDQVSSQQTETSGSDDVVAQVRTQWRAGDIAPGQSPGRAQSRWRAKQVEMQEIRVSRSPWVIRGLIGALALLLASEVLLLWQVQRSPDVTKFESGPTMIELATPVPDWESVEPPPVEMAEDPPLEVLPDPPTPTPLPIP